MRCDRFFMTLDTPGAGRRIAQHAVRRHATIGTMNTLLRIVLLLWVVGYLFVSCAPILDGHLLIGAVTFVGGVILFVPWVLGIVVLAALIRMTMARRAIPRTRTPDEPGRREVSSVVELRSIPYQPAIIEPNIGMRITGRMPASRIGAATSG